MIHFQYSQPTNFFVYQQENLQILYKLLDIEKIIGFEQIIKFKSLHYQKILYNEDKFYFGSGIAICFQKLENECVERKLLFGFKLLSGYKISDKFNTELFMQHFSNGETSINNFSYNFWELGISYNFQSMIYLENIW